MAFLEKETQKRWPGGCIPYVIDPLTFDRDPAMKEKIISAMKWWSDKCDLRFIERKMQSRYIRFIPDEFPMDGVCRSSTHGMEWFPTDIRLDPLTPIGVIAHEIGHAIGFLHEQKRPDRDAFININENQINPIYFSQFAKENNESSVNGYDLDSIMHYGPAVKMSKDGQTPLITTDDPANSNRIGNRSRLSSGDIAAGNLLNRGRLHAFKMSDGQVELLAQQVNWNPGWTHASSFNLDIRSFVFRYKAGSGAGNVNQINADGTIQSYLQNIKLSKELSHTLVYTVGLRKCLLLYNKSNGALELRGINGFTAHIDNTPFAAANWNSGWASISYYQAGLIGDYLLFYNKSNGLCRVDNLNIDGSIGQQKQTLNIGAGYDIVKVYKVNGKNYLLYLKTRNGAMKVRRINDSGLIGGIVQEDDWANGWSLAIPYQAGSKSYIFLLKESTGRVQINLIRNDGKVGAISDVRAFSQGWDVGFCYGVGVSNYIALIKSK